MKKLLGLMIVMLLVFAAMPVFAQETHECTHEGATISDLIHCFEHAVTMGHIDNNGVANGLFAKLAAAQAAQNRGQNRVAVNVLNALTHEVEAQAGVHIDLHSSHHMLAHIQSVIVALGG